MYKPQMPRNPAGISAMQLQPQHSNTAPLACNPLYLGQIEPDARILYDDVQQHVAKWCTAGKRVSETANLPVLQHIASTEG